MDKEKELNRIKYHWVSYVANGGIAKPLKEYIPYLDAAGLVHWTLFLKTIKVYLKKYPKDRHIIEGFIPDKLVKMLIGE